MQENPYEITTGEETATPELGLTDYSASDLSDTTGNANLTFSTERATLDDEGLSLI